MTRQPYSLIGIMIVGLTLTSCATIKNSNYKGYPVSTVPSGAQLSVNGQLLGDTPIVLAADRGSSHMIRIEKVGCPTFDTVVSSKVSPWVFGNLVFGGLIGLMIDMGTNAMYELNPDHVSVMYGERDGKCVITGSSLIVVQQVIEKPVQTTVSSGYVPYTPSESR